MELDLDVSPWPGLTIEKRASGGNRSEVWIGQLGGQRVIVRRSRRPHASLEWELALIDFLTARGFLVPQVVRAGDGSDHVSGVVVQRWLPGRPPGAAADWGHVAAELTRLHASTTEYRQRPGCCLATELKRGTTSLDADIDRLPTEVRDRVLAVFREMEDVPVAVVHGDPGASNIRINDSGRVGFLDWDESRVDLTWHDLSNLGVQVLAEPDHRRAQQLSHAWEAANGWLSEPTYARRRLESLHDH